MPETEIKRNVFQRWNAVLAAIKSLEKGGENRDQHYRYMKAADMLKMLRPILAANGLVLISNPLFETITDEEAPTRSGSMMHYVRMRTQHDLINIDEPNDRISLFGIADAGDLGDKALHKARTSALKFCLRDNFLIDDEADESDAETESSENTGSRRPMGTKQEAAPALRKPQTIDIVGRVLEYQQGSDDDAGRQWVSFFLHNFEQRLFAFNREWFPLIESDKLLEVRAIVDFGERTSRAYWKVIELRAAPEPSAAADQGRSEPDNPQAAPPIAPASAADLSQLTPDIILKRIFPARDQVKFRRLVEETIKDAPTKMHAAILLNFEARIKREGMPPSEIGLISALDISKTSVLEDFEQGNDREDELF